MPAQQPGSVHASQDGADFYFLDCDDQHRRVSYPGKVLDFDLAAAGVARAWFIAELVKENMAVIAWDYLENWARDA